MAEKRNDKRMESADRRQLLWGTDRLAPHLDDGGGPVRSFLGGVRLPLFNASWPLVRLDLFQAGLRLQGSTRWLHKLVPVWEAAYQDIIEVQAVGKIKWFSTGVRIRAGKGDGDWVVFWTVHRPEVLEAIEQLGVAVRSTPTRFYYLNPSRSESAN
jgi:hypothetical protein